MTNIFPQPTVPAGTTIAVALSQGIVSMNMQISGFTNPNPTLAELLANGSVSINAAYSSLSITNPATYGGN